MLDFKIRSALRLAGCIIGLGFSGLVLAADKPTSQHSDHPPAAKTPPAALSLADLEEMALQHNPTLAQAIAQVEISRGKAQQAGLYPNPTVGYVGEKMGIAGTAGELQGAFIEQEIITAGKLRLSRAKYDQEALQAELQRQAQQYRVLNSIKMGFYEVLAAQRLVEVRKSLVENAADALKTTEELVNVGQANEPDLLQAQIEANRAKVNQKAAESRYRRAWRSLAAHVGVAELPQTPLKGKLEPEGAPLDQKSALARLLDESPELQFAQAEVVRDQITLRREEVEPIPNLVVRGAAGYTFDTRNATADAQIGVRVPLFNRNQGTIRQARAELARANAEVTRVELSLRRRLADAFQRYETARDSVTDYQKDSLPKAKKAFDLYMQYFRKGRAAWPQVLVAERAYAQTSEEYVAALAELREAEVEIQGLLLVDGLAQRPEPTPQGHIDAIPSPR